MQCAMGNALRLIEDFSDAIGIVLRGLGKDFRSFTDGIPVHCASQSSGETDVFKKPLAATI